MMHHYVSINPESSYRHILNLLAEEAPEVELIEAPMEDDGYGNTYKALHFVTQEEISIDLENEVDQFSNVIVSVFNRE